MKWINHYGRPYIGIDIRSHRPVIEVVKWKRENNVRVLNVAGNIEPKSRAAVSRGITAFVIDCLL